MTLTATLQKIVHSQSRPHNEEDRSAYLAELLDNLLSGELSPEHNGAALGVLAMVRPSGSELAAMVQVLRHQGKGFVLPAALMGSAIDVCGTGGDGTGSFNISTCVAFVVAAAGVPVAKHGNRKVSSQCGSFDVLEALQISFAESATRSLHELDAHRLSFLYAPAFQPGLLQLAGLRKSLGFRTVLNALGPLLNPAGVVRQLIGVYSRDLVEPMLIALKELGTHQAMVVFGDDGSDEISLCGATTVGVLAKGQVSVQKIHPEQFGLRSASPESLRGGDALTNAQLLLDILGGACGPRTDIVIFNAAAALCVAGQVESIREGVSRARQVLASGAALQTLRQMQLSSLKAKMA